MKPAISGATLVAGVVGAPVTHSLSPLIHNAWLAAAGIDGVYVPFAPSKDGFAALVSGLRGGAVRGLNVTVPFKEAALALADEASAAARGAGAANLILFEPDGRIVADNTDGTGLLAALASQAPKYQPAGGVAVILGAGGAARGAAAALLAAGISEVRVLNRTHGRAEALAAALGDDRLRVLEADDGAALHGAGLIVNATTLGLGGGAGPDVALEAAPGSAVVMDMVYRPLRTEFLNCAASLGLTTVDGLEMLIGQAAPSFTALFGAPVPNIDVRGLCLAALEDAP
jgi:shikimate dehydrogenase